MMHWYEQWKPEFQRLGYINVGNEGRHSVVSERGRQNGKRGSEAQSGLRK